MKRKKRDYGTGCLYRRGKRWWVKLHVDGKPKYLPTGTTDKKEAQGFLARKLGERHRGELETEDAPKIGTLLMEYLERQKAKTKSLAPGTLATYAGEIQNHLEPFFRDVDSHKLTTDLLAKYRLRREKQFVLQGRNAKQGTIRKRAKKVSDSTINRELALLRSVLRSVKRGWPSRIGTLPYFPMERERNVRQGFVNDEAFVNKLYPVLPHHLRALAASAFFVGSRKNEWLMTDWPDVDFENHRVYVRQTKSGEPREVPIIAGLMEDALVEAKRRRDEFWPECEAVFSYEGRRLTTFKKAWATATRRAGLSGLLFHDMRRSANKGMRDRRVPQLMRMKIMGHKTAAMDRRYGMSDQTDTDLSRELIGKNRLKLKRVK